MVYIPPLWGVNHSHYEEEFDNSQANSTSLQFVYSVYNFIFMSKKL